MTSHLSNKMKKYEQEQRIWLYIPILMKSVHFIYKTVINVYYFIRIHCRYNGAVAYD